MTKFHLWKVVLFCALLIAVPGCDDDDTQPVADVGADVEDAAPDAAPDAVTDAVTDAAPDVSVDADVGAPAAEYEARFLIEHNAADDDTGFQVFFDWDPWRSLTVTGPGGSVLSVDAQGQLAGFGLTEMFFETNEPPANEVALDQVLARFPEGDYTFDALSVDGETLIVTATLTHDIPEAVEITAPTEDAQVAPDQPLTVSWTAVSQSLAGDDVDIEAYEVIVERDLDLGEGEAFSQLIYDATVPGSVTSFPVPAEFLRPGTPYEIEVLALEASGNQTIGATAFETTGEPTDDLTEVPDPGPSELAASKFLIEHNATDDDTGYQFFLDAEPWNLATVDALDGTALLEVQAQGELMSFGLTEMFFETNEPAADETPLEDVLALFPIGAYDFAAQAVEGMTMVGVATLSHDIPQATTISSPAEGAEVDPTAPLQVDWSGVTTSLEGAPVDVVAYQLIVVEEADVPPLPGFFSPELSVHVPADTTSVTVPAEFLQSGVEYEIEVLAIADQGNQTISLITFQTE